MSTPGKRAAAKKSSPPAQGDNFDARLAQVDNEFDGVVRLAESWNSDDLKSRESLNAALEATFGFGETVREEPELLEKFFKKREIKYSKRVKENPYIAVVKAAFPKLTAGSASQYSRVLRLAHDVKPSGVSLTNWLGEKNGIEGRYKEAVKHYAATDETKKQRLVDHKLQEALAALEKMKRSNAFELLEAASVDGYATALVRIAGQTHAEIVDFLEIDQDKLKPVLRRYCPRTRERLPQNRTRNIGNCIAPLILSVH